MSTNKIFAISDLVSRLGKIASENRYDQVSRIMHEVYENRMEKNPNLIVSSADIRELWSSVYNLNPQSNFTDNLDEVFGKEETNEITMTEGSPFRIAGFDEDFRPTPTEVGKTEEEEIKDASFNLIKKITSGNVVNPQYHYGQFVNVPQAGSNSGVALWTVAFNTKKGTAKISVPVNIINGGVNNPEVFYATGHIKGIPFTAENLKSFASSYVPSDKGPSTELSGFNQIGTNTIITEKQNIKEAQITDEQAAENNNIELSYSVPVDESLTANVGKIEEAFSEAIEEARAYVENKVKRNETDKSKINVNIQINYSGALGLDGKDIDSSSENVEGIFAFNASQKTRNGLKTITIPVIVANNQMDAPSFYTENSQIPLNSLNVMNYFTNESVQHERESSSEPTEAFSEAFTAFLNHDATYGQILEEIKASIKDSEYVKAASYLEIIGKRFGTDAVKQASDSYLKFVKEASVERFNDSNLSLFVNSNIGFK